MSPYRVPSKTDLVVAERPRSRLLRAAGSECVCTPPGFLWRWWHHVVEGDVWVCAHDGRWCWKRESGVDIFRKWLPAPKKVR